jgi:hypothetical protein
MHTALKLSGVKSELDSVNKKKIFSNQNWNLLVLTWRSGGETAFDSVHYAGREEGSHKLFLMKDVNFEENS